MLGSKIDEKQLARDAPHRDRPRAATHPPCPLAGASCSPSSRIACVSTEHCTATCGCSITPSVLHGEPYPRSIVLYVITGHRKETQLRQYRTMSHSVFCWQLQSRHRYQVPGIAQQLRSTLDCLLPCFPFPLSLPGTGISRVSTEHRIRLAYQIGTCYLAFFHLLLQRQTHYLVAAEHMSAPDTIFPS